MYVMRKSTGGDRKKMKSGKVPWKAHTLDCRNPHKIINVEIVSGIVRFIGSENEKI
jgi:hypothetical protein